MQIDFGIGLNLSLHIKQKFIFCSSAGLSITKNFTKSLQTFPLWLLHLYAIKVHCLLKLEECSLYAKNDSAFEDGQAFNKCMHNTFLNDLLF